MAEQTVRVPTTGMTMCYETFGDSSDPPILLIMGLGTQMIAWPDRLCQDLASRKRYVVRFDNRDAGRSTHLGELGAPNLLRAALRPRRAPYRMEDMAKDTLGLLDALGIESVHLVGASMGGFIAQSMATLQPGRLRSLTLIMTSTGSIRVGRPHPKVALALRKRRPVTSREEATAAVVEVLAAIGSTGYPFDEEYTTEVAGRAFDRGHDPSGYLRQMAAILTQRDRTKALRSLEVPTVVIHGLADRLVDASGGRALAKAIRGARFVGITGMGHDLPRGLWGRLADEISDNVSVGEARQRTVAR
ncbi:MAG: alpha/beta fold hydrolase [Acidimicrobiales bacterium]